MTGLPAVIKTRRLGYDGKGQEVVRSRGEAEAAVEELGAGLIVEGFVAFERELSVLAVAGREGGRAFYPLTENHHRGGYPEGELCPGARPRAAPPVGSRTAPAFVR